MSPEEKDKAINDLFIILSEMPTTNDNFAIQLALWQKVSNLLESIWKNGYAEGVKINVTFNGGN